MDLERLNPDSSISCPIKMSEIAGYLRVEESRPIPHKQIKFVRTARIEGFRYWLFRYSSRGKVNFAVVQARKRLFVFNATLLGCQENSDDLPPEEFLTRYHEQCKSL